MNTSGLNALGGLIAAMDLAGRIKEVMGKVPPGEFAKACGVSAGAVTQWLKGDTKTLKAEPVAHMEARYGYRASWIVTGKGPKKIDEHVDPGWRFGEELRRKVLVLPDEEVRWMEGVMRALLERPVKMALAVNNSQHSSSAQSDSAYAGLTEEGSGAMEKESLPKPSSNARQSDQRSAPAKGRRGA